MRAGRISAVAAVAVLVLGLVPGPVMGSDWRDALSRLVPQSRPAPTSAQMAEAIRQALAQGGDRAVRTLGRRDGFFRNPRVRIPMPPELRRVESVLRQLGQGRAADEFVRTLNRAAERAVPIAAQVLRKTISHMSVRDAVNIVRGPDDAATRYFERRDGKELSHRFLLIVRQTTAHVGVTRAYKRLMAQAGPAVRLMGIHEVDLDRYVTGRTVDGLFVVMAQEEKRIRRHPVARTTQLLKEVFGYRG
jgi:hypothetical protein